MRYENISLFLKKLFGTITELHITKILVLLLLTDLMFISLHVINGLDLVKNPLFLITRDDSYSEIFQYIKEFWIVLLIFFIGMKRLYSVYFVWSLLFVYILLDDSLRIHERGGDFLVTFLSLTPAFGLRSDDFGELIVFLFFGISLFSLVFLTFIQSDKIAKQTSMFLFALVMILAFFGVAIDMIHAMITSNWKIARAAFGIIEDGGEMIIMSIIVGFVYQLRSD